VSLLFVLPLILLTLAGTALARKLRKLDEPIQDPQELLETMPDWFTNVLIGTFRLVHLPTVVLLRFVAKHVAFRQQQKFLTGFLVSRIALCGSGNLEHDGRYQISAKAMVIDKLTDIGGFRGERPIFVFGHWLSQFCANSFLSIGSARQLLRAKQRLQIGLSDSNMSDLAEYVKVGSTSLMLDLIEAGHTNHLPVLKRPLHSLRHLASDWNLIARVPTSRGEMSAIDLQKAYLKAAESFVASTPATQRGEAPRVLARWRQLLESVSAFRNDANDTAAAIGRVDWLTKRWMIDRLGKNADWMIRKKIDLRYHELSRDGYFFQLKAARPDLALVNAEQIQRRRRSPPPCTPAARRGWLIREFANSEETMQSDWSFAIIGNGKNRKRVEFVESSMAG
jgi:hypothetical protein